MEVEDNKNEGISVISEHGTIEVTEVQSLHDHNIRNQTIIIDEHEKQEADGESDLKSTTLDHVSEENLHVSTSTMQAYTAPIMVESDLASSVCPVEPMDQSSHSLPRLAIAPLPEGSQNEIQSEFDDINQAWFTTKEDKDSLQGKGVKWRQGMWSKEESELLHSNIMQYCKSRGISDPREVVFKQSKEERKTFYRTIAKGIHRPLFAIYRRVLRTYETGNYNGKYTPDEVVKLKELKRKHGNDWTAIGLALGRSASSVKDRCRLLNEKCSTGKWSQDEEDRLSEAVHEVTSTVSGESITSGILWTDVARRVGTRSEKQCRSKWLNYLNWKECGGKEWNKTDEIDLIKKIYNLGVQNESEIDWSGLADGWASARSPQWLRSKWWTIKKHVPQYLSFPDIISYLHSQYAKSLKHRLCRHDTRYLQLPNAEPPLALNTTGLPLSPLTTCATVSTSVGHAITVDGEIYIARGDGKGSDGINTYEMVHLRPLPNTDPSQPTSYIIEPVQCAAVTTSATSYLLHQTSQDQGTKLVKVPSSSETINTHDDGNPQQNNRQENRIITQPVIVSPLPSNQIQLGADSLRKDIENAAAEIMSTPTEVRLPAGKVTDSYVENGATDILQQDQQLECVSEEEISTTVNTGLVTKNLPAGMITNEVMITQPSLPEEILQTQSDEAAFLTDSDIVVSSPLEEVTVTSNVSGISSESLIIENEMTYFK
ncbi:cyclin-D-binding Myb-like transcription factor 1 isoform X2 [Dendronephthya gigantea]|uniref:cyclin-D-binding Myb-like transcription factor 1 isoform X2 n=1 Tax=Dendronephthya gigantea TaxID=151771 RepID=UPI00106C97D5|nr:cyclin-D-binding Myb-like transcription factor 1 isoform X2 [Dendronephthya gigantea]